MNIYQDADGALWFKASEVEKPRRVCRVKEACRLLARTRRQVYRQIQAGILEPAGKMLDEWLLDLESVNCLALRPMSPQPIPKRLQPLLPEYDVAQLNAGKDQILLMSRVLESGGKEDIRWLMRRYTRAQLRQFIKEEGSRLLSARSLRLWSLYFQVKPQPLPSWRALDPWRQAHS